MAVQRDGAERRDRAVALLADRELAFRGTARRHSLCAADAEDAFQRAVEILLVKAPALDPGSLAAWMHVVTRREALALRRARLRLLAVPGGAADDSAAANAPGDPLDRVPSRGPGPEERVERRERVADAAARLAELKPDERRAIGLQALGYSYAEIGSLCGWTYTKVNRCLSEGRARLRSVTLAS